MDGLILWFQHNLHTLRQLGSLWLAIGLISLILTIVTLPLIILRLPADYFVRHRRVPLTRGSQHPAVAWLVTALKNMVGLILIAFGAIMLFIPGQGVLTMLIGVLLTNFPGKYRLEQRMVRNRKVLRTLNRIRRRGGHEPLISPHPDAEED